MFKDKIASTFKKYFSEFLLIFISVVLAFSLTEWSSNQSSKISEVKILTEIRNGLASDAKDLQANEDNHKISLRAVYLLRDWTNGKAIPQDSIALFYYAVFRNYTPIINKTGYESLKSSGLKTITNDSLRFHIISLYEFDYNIIQKLEDSNEEMQDFKNFFAPVNALVSPFLQFNEAGKVVALEPAKNLSSIQRKELLSYLWRMERNKLFKIMRYEGVLKKIVLLKDDLEKGIKEIE